ncbi:MAG: hypothetical protein M3Q36_04130 [bacterium]|nr:hypothetical protein [bacterium]
MSVDGQVLGVGTVGGATGGAVSALANTGSPVVVGLIVGAIIIIAVGLITRATK